MRLWIVLLAGIALFGLAESALAQPATISLSYFDTSGGGTNNPPLGCPCTGGSAYSDGVSICVYWDNDANGPDNDDPAIEVGTGPGRANFACFALNGDAQGFGAGYFYCEPALYFATPFDPDQGQNPECFLRINGAVAGQWCCWTSDTFNVGPGGRDFEFSDDMWECVFDTCDLGIDPPNAPTGFNASDDDFCLQIRFFWLHDGLNVSAFNVYEVGQPNPVASVNGTAREAFAPHLSEDVHDYYVVAENIGGSSPESNHNTGSTYLIRFDDGPSGDLAGDSLAGTTHTLEFDGAPGDCQWGVKLHLLYNLNTNPTDWGVLASCSTRTECTELSFTLPNNSTLNYCRVMMVDSSFAYGTLFYDTTESIFHLGNPGAVDNRGLLRPDRFDMAQNYPNPFNPETNILFNVPTTADVRISIYNIEGQLVRTLADGMFTAGVHQVMWDGRTDNGITTGTGLYLYRMEAPGFSITKKMLLMK